MYEKKINKREIDVNNNRCGRYVGRRGGGAEKKYMIYYIYTLFYGIRVRNLNF